MVKTRSASRLVDHNSSIVDSKVATRAASGGDHCSDEGDCDRSNLIPSCVKSPRKRHKKSVDDTKPSKKPRRRGRLELMPTMNLDILFHILSFLRPMDLLNLSRTSKDFRSLLLQRSSAAAWRSSRLQVHGLPDCPQDLSEPQYANLVFYPHCHGCDRIVRIVSWQIRARYCSKCLVPNTVDQFGFACSAVHQFGQRSLMWKDANLAHYLPSDIFPKQRYSDRLFLSKAYDEMLVEYSKTPQDEMAAFLDKKRKHVEEVMKHARQCQQWSESVASSRKYELDNLRCDRKRAIITLVTEAGYKPELDFVGILRFLQEEKALFKAKTLTAQAWNIMRPGLFTRLDNIRVRRLESRVYDPRRATLMSEYKKYLQKPPPPGAAFDVMPHAADVAEFDPFRNLIMSPESVTITASSFHSAFQQLPDLVSSWRAKIDREFIGKIRFPKNNDGGKQSGSDILHLATSVFVMQSGRDHRLLMYPEALSWPGFFCPPKHRFGEVSLPGVKQFDRLPWSVRKSLYLTTINVFEGATAVVRASGLDPKTACRQDMDKLDARFSCGKCSSPGRKVVMRWEMAIIHSYRVHRDVQPEELEWILIEGDELASVKNYEDEDKSYLKLAIVHCALCQHHIGDAKKLFEIQDHLARIHEIPSDKAKHGSHYIADHNSIPVVAVVLDSDGKVSKHVDLPTVPSFCHENSILHLQTHWL